MTDMWIVRRAAALFTVVAALALVLVPSADAFIYWASPGGLSPISRANLDGSGGVYSFVYGAEATGSGLAVDGTHLYWDSGPGTIGWGNLDGSDEESPIALNLQSPGACGVAVDGGHIYWASGSTIGRANLDGSHVEPNFITNLTTPCGVAVDPAHIYWTTSQYSPAGTTIGRASLDGSHVEPNFMSGLTGAMRVAVDSSHIYWTDPINESIGRAELNGTAVNESFIIGLPEVCGIALDSEHIYWTVHEHKIDGFEIGRGNLDGSNVNQSFINAEPGEVACGIAVDSLWPASTSLTPSSPTITYGQPLSFKAVVASTDLSGASANPTGTVNFTVTGEPPTQVQLNGSAEATLAPAYYLNPGDEVTARYSGNATYGPSRTQLVPTIQPANTETALAASPNPQNATGSVEVIATVKNLSDALVPFGEIRFRIDGGTSTEPVPLDEAGHAGIVISGLASGQHTIFAEYSPPYTGPQPDFTDSWTSLIENITPPSSTKPTAGPPPTPTAFQASLTVFPLATTVSSLMKHGLGNSVTLNAPGSITEDLYAENGTIPVTAAIAKHKHAKRHRTAVLLATGSASTTTATTVTVKLTPTPTGTKFLKKAHHAVPVVLLTTIKDTGTGVVDNLPAKRFTLKH